MKSWSVGYGKLINVFSSAWWMFGITLLGCSDVNRRERLSAGGAYASSNGRSALKTMLEETE